MKFTVTSNYSVAFSPKKYAFLEANPYTIIRLMVKGQSGTAVTAHHITSIEIVADQKKSKIDGLTRKIKHGKDNKVTEILTGTYLDFKKAQFIFESLKD